MQGHRANAEEKPMSSVRACVRASVRARVCVSVRLRACVRAWDVPDSIEPQSSIFLFLSST
jgi:hypothetical protein